MEVHQEISSTELIGTSVSVTVQIDLIVNNYVSTHLQISSSAIVKYTLQNPKQKVLIQVEDLFKI